MYMYNVWVNWTLKQTGEQTTLQHYEWRESDPIEKLVQTRMIHVNRFLFDSIYYHEMSLPHSIKKTIFYESYVMRYGTKYMYPYVCVLTDKIRACAIRWEKEGAYFIISHLLPHQERYVLEHSKQPANTKKRLFSIPFLRKKQLNRETIGLTRLEKEKRALLLDICEQLYKQASEIELTYWLKEWYYEQNEVLKQRQQARSLWSQLIVNLRKGWTIYHERFFAKVSVYYFQKQIPYTKRSIHIQLLNEGKKCYNEHHSTE